MNKHQRNIVVIAVIAVACLLARYVSYPEHLRPFHNEWLSLAILVAAVGISAFIWMGRKR